MSDRSGVDQAPSGVGLDAEHVRNRPAWFLWAALITVAVVLALRFVQLDRVPGELYGDIAIVYDYIADIRAGRWPMRFVLSAGPLYHYVATPVVWLAGLNFLGLKLASVAVSLGVLLALYALGRELLDDGLALLAVFIAGVSSWLLIFSRLGNSQILVPLLTTGAIYLAVRVARRGRDSDAVACAVVAALGLYAYPPSFVLPPVMFVTLLCLSWTGAGVRREHLLLFLLVTLACALPFAAIVARDPANFFTGYIGGKLAPDASLLDVLLGNVMRGLLALHVRGDSVFRSNPASLPHLDIVSGVLFLGGLLFWLSPERRRLSPALLLPLFLLQLPSMLVLSHPREVPSASRSLGIAPIAYILVASGLWWLATALRARRTLALLAVIAALEAILLLNAYRYFEVYADGLPNDNTPFGRIIADYVDNIDPEMKVYMIGCCWGEAGQPEPKGVAYVLRRQQGFYFLERAKVSCQWLLVAPRPAIAIWSPREAIPAPQLAGCPMVLEPQMHASSRGDPVFHAAVLPPAPSSRQSSPPD